MPAADEQQLILHVKEGSHEAFRILVERYMKQAYNIAYGFVENHDDAEDIAQESFVRVYNSIGSFRGDAQFSTWLYRIVMNLSLNRMKRNRTHVTTHVDEHFHAVEALQHGNPSTFHETEAHSHIERALHELPTLQRAVVILRHIDGLSTRQVSNILRCSEGTVKTHLHRGLKKMKKRLHFLKEDVL